MSITRIAFRYAKSILDLAQEQNKLERVAEDMRYFDSVCEVKDFNLMIKSPVVPMDKKMGVFKELFEDRFDPLSYSFLEIILKKGREMYLPTIADEFRSAFKKRKNISSVTITTASPLGEQALERIQNELIQATSTDKNIELKTKVDPAILGGFILEFDDRLYNASAAHKLREFAKEITDTSYIKNI